MKRGERMASGALAFVTASALLVGLAPPLLVGNRVKDRSGTEAVERATSGQDLATGAPDGASVTVEPPQRSAGTVKPTSPDGTSLVTGQTRTNAVFGQERCRRCRLIRSGPFHRHGCPSHHRRSGPHAELHRLR